MRFLFCNVRGLGKGRRRRQVKEYIDEHNLEVVGLQETVRETFTDRELLEIAGSRNFSWKWAPAKGRSGGILMGLNQDSLELEDFDIKDFCVVMSIRDRRSNFRWVMVTVYGPVDHGLSREFLEELGTVCSQSLLPIILGRDFNLIREEDDKNSETVSFQLMDIFNEFIGTYQLRELKRSGQKYTWTNKRDNPIMVNLDRVFFFHGMGEVSLIYVLVSYSSRIRSFSRYCG